MRTKSVLKRMTALVMMLCILIVCAGEGAVSYSTRLYNEETTEPMAASGEAAEDEYTVLKLDATKRSQSTIKTYIAEHLITTDPVVYDTAPSYAAPGKRGTISQASLDNMLNSLNIYRYIAGVTPAAIDSSEQTIAMDLALVWAANGNNSNVLNKPAGFSDTIFQSASKGHERNIGGLFVDSVSYKEFIRRNIMGVPVGYDYAARRKLLDPYLTKTGMVEIDDMDSYNHNIYLVLTKKDSKLDKIIAYPAQNQPLEFFKATDDWTVSLPVTCSKNNVSVTITDTKTSKNLDVTVSYVSNVNGGSYVVFKPEIMEFKNGDKFHVLIKCEDEDSKKYKLEYDVAFFPGTSVAVESVKVNPETTSVYEKGDEVINGTFEAEDYCKEINVTINPYDANNQYVTYTVGNSKIARVEKVSPTRARIIGIKQGETTVTAKVGDKTSTTTVKVVPRAQGITVNVPEAFSKDSKGYYIVGRGQSDYIKLTITPDEAEDRGNCKVTDGSIAEVYYTGSNGYKITGLKNGSTTVKFYAKSNSTVTETIKVKVVDPVLASSISFKESTVTYVIPDDASEKPVFKPELIFSPSNTTWKKYKLSYSESGPAFIISDVNVKVWSPGKTTITATTLDGSEKTASFELIVRKKLNTPDAPAVKQTTSSSITLDSTISTFDNLRLYYEFSKDKKNWQKSNVFENLTPGTEYTFYKRAVGLTDDYVTSEISEGTKATTTEKPSSIQLMTDKTNILVGEQINIKGKILPEQLGDDRLITWKSSDSTIASVTTIVDSSSTPQQKIIVTGKKAGTVTITATSKSFPDIKESVTITVYKEDYLVNITQYPSNREVSQRGIQDGNRYMGSIYLSLKNDKPCMLLVSTDKGKTYTRKVQQADVTNDWHDYTFDIKSDMKLAICLAGDVNIDGKVDSADALLILRYDVNKATLNNIQLLAADVSKDGKVDSADALLILRSDVNKAELEW